MENQPTRQWFRLASQAIRDPPQPAPTPAPQPVTAGPPPRRGPPIRQASLALARSTLALENATPVPDQTTLPLPSSSPTQPTPPPPSPRVPTPPPPVAAAPPPLTTAAPRRVPSPPLAMAPPPALSEEPTTIMIPRTITPPTTVALPRTITPPPEPAPPKTQTPPPAAEPPERKFYRELTPPKPATSTSPTVAVQPLLARPPSGRNSNGNDLAVEKPLVNPTSMVFPRPVATRALTPPESPKVIKTSPTPPQSPRIKPQQSAPNMRASSEPEPRTSFAPQPKINGLQGNSDRNYGPKTSNGGQGELQKFIIKQNDTRNAPPPSPKKDEKHAAMANGKAFATGKDEKETRIITIAGENHGAIMDLGSGRQLRDDNAKGHAGSDDGKSSKMSNAMSKTKPMISLTNSNVQCVNNSILFNASSVSGSPGVHINFTRTRQPKNTTSSTPQSGQQTLQ